MAVTRQPEAARHRRTRGGRPVDAHDDGRELSRLSRRDHGSRSHVRDAGPGAAVRRGVRSRQRRESRVVRRLPVQGEDERGGPRGENDHRCHGRVGAPSRVAFGADADGARRVDLRDVRRLLLPRAGDCGRRRRRLGDGRGDLSHTLRHQSHAGAPARHATRVEDHAGQGPRQPEDRLDAGQRRRSATPAKAR